MRRQRGFTLIELMIALAVIGVVTTLAAGYSGNFFRKNRLNQLARGVYAVVSMARAEAVRRGCHTVVVFNSGDVVAFVDVAGGNAWQLDGTDTVLTRYPFQDASMISSVIMDTTGLTTGYPGNGSITPVMIFDSNGFSRKLSSGSAIEQFAEVGVTFTHNGIPSGQNVYRRVSATAAGAIRVTSR